MSYVKTSPIPPGLNSGETAVTLDDGTVVAVSVVIAPQDNNAPSVIVTTARQINADGTPVQDAYGRGISREYRHSPSPEQVNDPTSFAAVQKDCVLAVLGEPVIGPLNDPIHANALANLSIRNRIAALKAAGTVDAGALL